jgi:DNA-binding NarL/FixJ family response regulator
MKSKRLLLVDDHIEVLKRVGARLAHEDDIYIAGEARDGSEVIQLVNEVQPDVILIDPVMQDGKGMEILREIRDQYPSIDVVVLTSVVDAAMQVELKKMGIHGVLEKGVNSDALVETLRKCESHPPA